MQKKILNPQILLEIVCYVVFAIVMFYLVVSGKYQSYVTPRMVPYFYFTGAVMTIWSFESLLRLYKPKYKTRAAHCLVLAVPIMLLMLPHSSISSENLSSVYLNGNISTDTRNNSFDTDDGQTSSGNSSAVANNRDDNSSDSKVQANDEAEIYTVKLSGLDELNKEITVEDDEYYPWLEEIYTNMYKYEGYQISIKGCVFRDPETMAEDEFVPARLLMTCCVADLSLCGIICKYDKVSELEENTWITVEGVIQINEYMNQNEPQISVTKTSPAQKPYEEYVYPF